MASKSNEPSKRPLPKTWDEYIIRCASRPSTQPPLFSSLDSRHLALREMVRTAVEKAVLAADLAERDSAVERRGMPCYPCPPSPGQTPFASPG